MHAVREVLWCKNTGDLSLTVSRSLTIGYNLSQYHAAV